ncbi:ArsR/SmtB family transcription factor [Priestia filamentosa]|uniref:Transcriptional regulator n=1 Tax=Priestia filamentosa TaxID=1402861 RepID=A0A1X7EDK0_9BACI|nr:metalloregulator ArsR/SmtB family transcription factor [Priestia filamentosa]AKO92820.1 transcriptional regulator [Priestia filamentosa]MDT3762861.1 metalloregulator ArsR/SmtB family transcription factor [Priestia filamentosa]OXS69392.1 transcriptional regulator [Priestia filamentosa]RJS63894.1 transcriptional regulator [Priestia filamentosa]WCM13956.1 metalloregulator ArsR/SmtB family transcription factor [Priestia filamentosa]
MRTPYQPSRQDIKLPSVLHALSDPLRLKIVKGLSETTEQYCSPYLHLNVAKSTLSHHFKVLREAGVIKVRIEGTQHFYSLRTEDLEALFPGLLPSVLRADEAHME